MGAGPFTSGKALDPGVTAAAVCLERPTGVRAAGGVCAWGSQELPGAALNLWAGTEEMVPSAKHLLPQS